MLTFCCMSVLMTSALPCQPQLTGKLAEKHEIYLNQALLRDATGGLSRIWNTRIDLDPDVSSISGLWIDYAPRKELTLRDVLDEILRFVKDKHKISLRWKADGDRIQISKDKSEQAVDGKPPKAPQPPR